MPLEPLPSPTPSLAQLLRDAMDAAGITSNRRLAVLLAGTTERVAVENARGMVRRLLRGEQQTVHRTTAERLSEILGVPVDYWPTSRVTVRSTVEEIALELKRQLDAGVQIPPDKIEEAAAAIEQTAYEAMELAKALRLRARAARPEH